MKDEMTDLVSECISRMAITRFCEIKNVLSNDNEVFSPNRQTF